MKLLLLRSKKGKTSDDSSKGSGGSRELKKSGHSRKHKDGAGGSLDKSKGSSGRFIITPKSGSYNFVPDPKIQNFLSELVIQPDDTQPQPSFTTPHYTSNRATSPHVRLQPISFRPG